MERRFVLLSDTIPQRPAELGPIRCPRCQGQQQGKRSSSRKQYSVIHVQGEAPEPDDSSRDCEAKRVHLSLFPSNALTISTHLTGGLRLVIPPENRIGFCYGGGARSFYSKSPF